MPPIIKTMADTGYEVTELNEQMVKAIKFLEQAQHELNLLIMQTPTGKTREALTDIFILQESAINELR